MQNDSSGNTSTTDDTSKLISVAPPTATLVMADQTDAHFVWVLEPTNKHNGKFVCVGGKIELHQGQTPRQCALDEFREEAGGMGARIANVQLIGIATDPYRDVREVTLAKATNASGPAADAERKARAYYGACDSIFAGRLVGTPVPKDGEAKRFIKLDLRELECAPTQEESRFGAGHDIILFAYLLWMKGQPLDPEDLMDFKGLRNRLPALVNRALRK